MKLYKTIDYEADTDGTFSGFAIGIEGTKEEIELKYNSLFNFGATNGSLTYLSDNFAYIWTNTPNFKKYLLTSALASLINGGASTSSFKGKEGGVMEVARKLAEINASKYEVERFLGTESFSSEYYNVITETNNEIYV